jgi:hypothetical protein
MWRFAGGGGRGLGAICEESTSIGSLRCAAEAVSIVPMV